MHLIICILGGISEYFFIIVSCYLYEDIELWDF